jgi:hypothetical protein
MGFVFSYVMRWSLDRYEGLYIGSQDMSTSNYICIFYSHSGSLSVRTFEGGVKVYFDRSTQII